MSQGRWFLYNTTTGAIDSSLNAPVKFLPEPPDGFAYIPMESGMELQNLYYVDVTGEAPVITDREELTSLTYNNTAVGDGSDSIDIEGIPLNTFVSANLPDGFAFTTVDDGNLSLTSELPGTVSVYFQPPTYLETTIEVTFT